MESTIAEQVDHLLRDARLAELGSELAADNHDTGEQGRLADKSIMLRDRAERIDPQHVSLAWGCH